MPPSRSSPGEILSRAAIGLLVAASIAVVTGIACAFSTKGITQPGAIFSLGSGALAGILAYFFSRDPNRPPLSAWDILMLAIFGIASFRAFMDGAPNHERVPEALLAVANCQAEMKDSKGARVTLADLLMAKLDPRVRDTLRG